MEVFKTSEGEIDEVIIDSGGSGYRPNVNVTVNNDDTNGKNFTGRDRSCWWVFRIRT